MEALQKKPTVHGTLRAHPLASLLASIAANGSTATLVLTGPSGEVAEIVVVAGQLAKIRVPEPLYLSSVAYELGYVSAEELNASLLDVARFRRLHGTVLLERKLLTPTQLRLCLLEQAKRKLHRMFAWPDTTTAELIPDHDALQRYGGADTPTCELRPLVWCGIREFAPSRQVDAWLAATEGHRFRGRTRRPSASTPRSALSSSGLAGRRGAWVSSYGWSRCPGGARSFSATASSSRVSWSARQGPGWPSRASG